MMGNSVRPGEAAITEGGLRRFACTSCGRCCDGGPEMELGEAAALAETFITRVMFKVHSLPLYETSRRAALWHGAQVSQLPVGPALAEMREHLSRFSVRDEIDKARGRSLHLTISAIAVDLEPVRCPALRDNVCSIYDVRPLTCRTVPLHYSRPPSSLAGYLDEFVAKPGHACSVSATAPVALNGQAILDEAVEKARSAAFEMSAADYAWKREIAAAMADPDTAAACGLPSHELVQQNSDRGVASLVSMLAPWRIATRLGVLSDRAFETVCREQARLLAAALAGRPSYAGSGDLQAMLLDYEVENARAMSRPLGVLTQRNDLSAWPGSRQTAMATVRFPVRHFTELNSTNSEAACLAQAGEAGG